MQHALPNTLLYTLLYIFSRPKMFLDYLQRVATRYLLPSVFIKRINKNFLNKFDGIAL